MAEKSRKTQYGRRPRRKMKVWQRLFLTLGILGVLLLFGTAVVIPDRLSGQTNDAAAAGPDWDDPVEGYVVAPVGEGTAQIYTEGLSPLALCSRGLTLTIESWEPYVADDGSEYYHVWYDNGYAYIATENISTNPNRVLQESMIYVRTTVNLYNDAESLELGTLVEKGSSLVVLGFDYLESDGTAHMYQVKYGDVIGWIRSEYITIDFSEAMENWSDEGGSYSTHAARGDYYGGGSAKDLDYFPRTKGSFSAQGNTMPDACYCLYVPAMSSALTDIDSYLALAEGTEINTFVFTVSDDFTLACPFECLREEGVLGSYECVLDAGQFGEVVQKVQDAGYYTVARIGVFQDAALTGAMPELAYSDVTGGVLQLNGASWPSLFSRKVWQIKAALAVEAVETYGFNEVMFDYVESPYGLDDCVEAGADLKNEYGETRAQALQRFLMYAADVVHDHGAYISTTIMGDTVEAYVTLYGQYWAAFSDTVDVLCPTPYPENYNNYWTSSGYYYSYEHPYEILSNWAEKVIRRQAECSSPAVVRPWIQSWDERTYRYDAAAIQREVLGLYDLGITGGYAPWTRYGDLAIYNKMLDVFNTDYYTLYQQAAAQGQSLSSYMGVSTSDDQSDEE